MSRYGIVLNAQFGINTNKLPAVFSEEDPPNGDAPPVVTVVVPDVATVLKQNVELATDEPPEEHVVHTLFWLVVHVFDSYVPALQVAVHAVCDVEPAGQ
jgi:hypothetical protein